MKKEQERKKRVNECQSFMKNGNSRMQSWRAKQSMQSWRLKQSMQSRSDVNFVYF